MSRQKSLPKKLMISMLMLLALSSCQDAPRVPTSEYIARSTIPEPVIPSDKVLGLFQTLSIDKDFREWFSQYTTQQEQLDALTSSIN